MFSRISSDFPNFTVFSLPNFGILRLREIRRELGMQTTKFMYVSHLPLQFETILTYLRTTGTPCLREKNENDEI